MRKIAAQYIFPIIDKPIKYGIITLDDDGTIVEISQSNNNLNETASVEFYNGILVPGFVNAHCHLELSHMVGALPQAGGMGAFCEGVMGQRNKCTIKEQQNAAILADERMYKDGIIAVGDISNTTVSFEAKRHSKMYYHTFVECLGFDDNRASAIIENALSVQNSAQQQHLTATITPHAPYSMSEKLFASSIQQAQHNGILSIHNQESKDEMDLFTCGNSKLKNAFEAQGFIMDSNIFNHTNPLNRLLQYINNKANLLLIHNVYTAAEDVERVEAINNRVSWVLCPNSNLYIENTLPPVKMLSQKHVNIAIGTDSLASNTSLSVLNELKTLTANFPEVELATLLYWATLGGAKAILKSSELGSFEVGKRPGVTLIEGVDFDNMRLTPYSQSSSLL